jgi:SAM-dependent methyltransferase
MSWALLDWLLGKRSIERDDGSSRSTSLGLSDVAPGEAGKSPPTPPPVRHDRRWLVPPDDVHDAAAWDRYWTDQITHGLPPQLFDLFSDDRELIAFMIDRGFESVLCAGNGMSQEPQAFQAAGFRVTALDLSPVAAQIAQAMKTSENDLSRFVDAESLRPGGSLDYVTGDLLDPAVCPGPFDVIIERRTVQLFRGAEFSQALEALSRRLRSDGLFFSHCHDGRWRPPAPRVHKAEEWFRAQGWAIWEDERHTEPRQRLVKLFITTG